MGFDRSYDKAIRSNIIEMQLADLLSVPIANFCAIWFKPNRSTRRQNDKNLRYKNMVEDLSRKEMPVAIQSLRKDLHAELVAFDFKNALYP